jgi:predicted dehydrogenase
VLEDDDVTAVALATPPSTHARLAIAALEAGKHVLIEKPLAPSLAEARSIVETARRSDRVAICDHTYCYTPAVLAIRALIAKGEIGELHYFDSVRVNLGIVQSDVDVFWDLAYHDLAILDVLMDGGIGVLEVSARGADPMDTGRACMGYVTLLLDTGAIAHTHVNWLSPTKVRRITMGGSDRMVVWDDLDPSERLRVYDRGVVFGTEMSADERRRSQVSYRLGDVVAPELAETEPLANVIEEFRVAIVEGRPPLTDADAGLRVVRVLDVIDQSQRAGGSPMPICD